MERSRRNAPLVIIIAGFIALLLERRPWIVKSDQANVPAPSRQSTSATGIEKRQPESAPSTTRTLPISDPSEARAVQQLLERIDAGGPFLHRKDGATFRNAEGRLPSRPSGYYHEFTVETPGSPDRGARRIIRGNGGELYYTNDHYRSFRRIDSGAQ